MLIVTIAPTPTGIYIVKAPLELDWRNLGKEGWLIHAPINHLITPIPFEFNFTALVVRNVPSKEFFPGVSDFQILCIQAIVNELEGIDKDVRSWLSSISCNFFRPCSRGISCLTFS
jgi:hypothetical protein